ncbi:MAG: AAA family ATPase, partial [Thermoplasmata archaeon]|nr:AAA family ATPase [Thermoplasmata archaeon]
MEELALHQPELIGRDEELNKLKQSLDNAIAGNGSTVFIAGEAGIGKTRLVSEIIKEAEAKNVQLIQGWCLAESLEPLMPVRMALREAGLLHIISDDPPPLVVSAYLLNKAGMLIAQVEREETNLDSDIFAGMLQAVGNFIQDSLSIMKGNRDGSLNSLGYGDYNILIQSVGNLSLAIVIKGTNSEFLIEDMKATLNDIGDKYDNWSGNMASAKEVQPKISWFVNSGKFDGDYIVDDPKIKQENLFDNALLGIQRESVDKPLMLFLDDLQWSDPTTLNLIQYLSRNTKHNNVLIVCTYRPEDMLASHDGKTHHLEIAMQNMNRESLFSKIELNRLGSEETEMIIESALGISSFDESFFEKIHRESGGTPFFILEVVKLLIEDRVIEQDENEVWKLISSLEKADIPSKVYDVVKRRLDRLMDQQRELLECASVIGDEFSTNVLEKTTDMRKLALLNNLSDIEKTHRLIHYLEDKYRFDHAKIREVLYNGMGKELRMEYHKIVGDTIVELHKDNLDDIVNELAYHYFEARDERAGEYLVKAGDKAKNRYANEEASRFYTSAETMLDDGELLKLHENLGDVLLLMGKREEAVESFRKARELTDDIRTKGGLIFKAANALEKNSDYELSRKEAKMGMDMLGDAHGPERCKLLTIMSWT